MAKFNQYNPAAESFEDDDLLLIRQASSLRTKKIPKSNMSASDTSRGFIRKATDAEVSTGTETDAAVNPAQLAAKISAQLEGLKWKDTVKAATTANITLSGEQTIDGVSVVAGDRVLVKNQNTQTQNGIYVAAAGAWSRSTDASTGAELQSATVPVDQGTSNANTTWRQTADNITIGSSNVVFASFADNTPDATESVKGKVELATIAETRTGTDTSRAITPAGAAAVYLPNIDINNQASGATSVVLDFKSGVAVFTDSIPGNSVLPFSISNSTISEGDVVIMSLGYNSEGGGDPGITSYYTNNGSITVKIRNHENDATTGQLIVGFTRAQP